MHDGNGLGRVHDGKGGGRRIHDDYIDVQSNQLSRKLLETFSLASCIPALDNKVAALLVPVISESLDQLVVKAFMSVGDKSDPPNFSCPLRARRERPGYCPAAEQSDELAPRAHSITSSARASKVAGTSRPSALAVFRLIISSYLVGACTGRSAGFSPLRMRST